MGKGKSSKHWITPPLGAAVRKYCNKCEIVKSVLAYNRASKPKDGLAANCRKCSHEMVRVSMSSLDSPERAALKEKKKEKTDEDVRLISVKDKDLRAEYGISLDEYEEMLIEQGGVCAVCEEPETQKLPGTGALRQLSVHHNHADGKVIALCCNKCNWGMGMFNDDSTLMRLAAEINDV